MIRNRVILSGVMLLIIGLTLSPAANAQIAYQLPGWGLYAAVGDFNDDGIPDLVGVTRFNVAIYTGDGSGHFNRTTVALLKARISGPPVATDFYGNGKVEAVVPMLVKGLAIVGEGGLSSFYKVDVGITAVQFNDLDGDGIPDMLLSNGALKVYRGLGGGHFTNIGSYPGADANLVLGDFNADGKIDAAATDASGVSVFLGNGDGTFRTALHTDGSYTSIAAADFNHDGELDLVAGTWESPFVTVLLGNGDGTFIPQPSYNTGQYYSASVVAGDFNRDGNPDVAVADACWTKGWPCNSRTVVTILPGNGDGTLQPPASYDGGGAVVPGKYHKHNMFITSADVDHNGATDLITVNQTLGHRCGGVNCPGALAILLGNGDGTFQSAPVNSHFLTSTVLTSSPNPSTYGQAVMFTASVTSDGPVAPTGTVRFTSKGLSVQGILSGGIATFTTSSMLAGTTSITATYSGDSLSYKSKSSPLSQAVNQAPTTTTLTSTHNPSKQGRLVALTATVTSSFATPKGTVTFKVGDEVLGTVKVSNGKATYRTADLPVGSTNIGVTYNPEANHLGVINFLTSSGSMTQVVE